MPLLLASSAGPAARADGPPAATTRSAPAKFVVHEWGVSVLSSTDHGPVLSAPREEIAGLPPFVTRHEAAYQPRHQARNWDKPVLHFYGPDGLTVRLRVLTANGLPLAYYPRPTLLEETFWQMGSGTTYAVGMEWAGTLTAAPTPAPPDVPQPAQAWWDRIRQVPGLYFQSTDPSAGNERFVFYEGTAYQGPTITARVEADTLTLQNGHAEASGPVLLIANDGRTLHLARVDTVPGKGQATLRRGDLLAAIEPADDLVGMCQRQWRDLGLTEAEGSAVVAVWRKDLAESVGLLLVSPVPRPIYDQMFPLTITPAPAEVVRVGMVFDSLAGQPSRGSWLPKLSATFEDWAKELSGDDYARRRAAEAKFAAVGDLAEPFLRKLAESDTEELRLRARSLLDRLGPQKIKPLPSHGRGSNQNLIHRDYRNVPDEGRGAGEEAEKERG